MLAQSPALSLSPVCRAPVLSGAALGWCRWQCILSSYHIHLCVLILATLNEDFEVGVGIEELP